MSELSKLEQVAAMAMHGFCSCHKDRQSAKHIAGMSVAFAKALLAECAKHEPNGMTTQDEDGWIPHVPGDPMPCDDDARVHVKFLVGGASCHYAKSFIWTEHFGGPAQIIAWKPA